MLRPIFSTPFWSSFVTVLFCMLAAHVHSRIHFCKPGAISRGVRLRVRFRLRLARRVRRGKPGAFFGCGARP